MRCAAASEPVEDSKPASIAIATRASERHSRSSTSEEATIANCTACSSEADGLAGYRDYDCATRQRFTPHVAGPTHEMERAGALVDGRLEAGAHDLDAAVVGQLEEVDAAARSVSVVQPVDVGRTS